MPYTAPTVNYSATPNGTYTTLTGVQSVVINRGRQRFQDPVRQSSCTIELVPAASYALPLAVGQYIDVKTANTATSDCYFSGVITDVSRTYAIPYNSVSGSAPADRITISASGGTGSLGRADVNNLALSTTVSSSIAAVLTNIGVTALSSLTSVANTSQTVTGPALDVVNTLLQTAQFIMDDVDWSRDAIPPGVLYGPNGFYAKNVSFADNGTATKFREIQYESSVQSTFNYVSVEPVGGSNAVTTSGVAPYNSLNYKTYSTAADATSLSGYLYNLLNGFLAPVPFTVATDVLTAPACMDYATLASPNSGNPNHRTAIGGTASIVFRGSTVYGVVVGVSSVFTVNNALIRFYVVPSLGTPFTLDSAVLGVLNQNRLGFP